MKRITKDDRIEIRVNKAEKASWKASAKAKGLTLCEYVRTRMN